MRRRDFITGLAGAAIAAPRAAYAQQPSVPVIGYLSAATLETGPTNLEAFRQGLAQTGYVEGRNVDILFRQAEYHYDRLPALAADLVGHRVAVIVTTAGAAAALAARGATSTIPIVFQLGSDPVRLGLVASFNRPGGNITGVSFLTGALTAKRLELLHEAAPAATTIGYLFNPNGPDDGRRGQAEAAAHTLGVRMLILNVTAPSEIEAAFATVIEQRVGALLVDSDPLFAGQRRQLAALAARYGMPAIYHIRETVEAGGLMSYGANASDAYRLAGAYVGRILRGEKPADLPVQQSAEVELAINLGAAKALGLAFPLSLLGRADEVIE
jgi:putative ABC transport system substrate-binding protein